MKAVTRYHSDPGDIFVRMFFIPMDWDCHLCNSVFTVKTRLRIAEIEEWLLEQGWRREGATWTCPDCVLTSRGSCVTRKEKGSFWYGCS